MKNAKKRKNTYIMHSLCFVIHIQTSYSLASSQCLDKYPCKISAKLLKMFLEKVNKYISYAWLCLIRKSTVIMNKHFRGLITCKQSEPDFYYTCYFHQILDDIEVSSNMILMTGFTYMGKNLQKCPLNRGFPFETPLRFFQKSGSATFVPLLCPNFMSNTKKTKEQSLTYLKTNQQTNKD